MLLSFLILLVAQPTFARASGLSLQSKALVDRFYEDFSNDNFRTENSTALLKRRWEFLDSHRERLSNDQYLCRLYLSGTDLSGTDLKDFFSSNPSAELAADIFERYRNQVQTTKPLGVIAKFLNLSSELKRALLFDLLKNFEELKVRFNQLEAKKGLIPARVRESLENYFFASLLNVPFTTTQESIEGDDPTSLDMHWSARNADISINSSLRDLNRVQFILGPMDGLMVDIGSGFGIPGIYFSLLNPKLRYLGIDIVGAKSMASRQIAEDLGLKNLSFTTANVAEIPIPNAKYYFFYNPINRNILNQTLRRIAENESPTDTYLIFTHAIKDPFYGNLEIPPEFSVFSRSANDMIVIYHRPGVGR